MGRGVEECEGVPVSSGVEVALPATRVPEKVGVGVGGGVRERVKEAETVDTRVRDREGEEDRDREGRSDVEAEVEERRPPPPPPREAVGRLERDPSLKSVGEGSLETEGEGEGGGLLESLAQADAEPLDTLGRGDRV